MATHLEKNLAMMLDKMAGDLANDLEWALEQLEYVKVPQSVDLASRYLVARRHLNHRRAYEEACDKAEVMRHM